MSMTATRGTVLPRLAELVRLPFQVRTWRHLIFAAIGPLGFGVLQGTQYAMRWNRSHGQQQFGVLLLLGALLAVGLVGPTWERARTRWLLGQEIGRRPSGRLRGGALMFFFNLLVSTLLFLLAVGWVLISARNLSYPIWGWAPYPDPAWGGPTALGAVTLHFAAGVAIFFLGPWAIIRLTDWQVRTNRRLIGDGA